MFHPKSSIHSESVQLTSRKVTMNSKKSSKISKVTNELPRLRKSSCIKNSESGTTKGLVRRHDQSNKSTVSRMVIRMLTIMPESHRTPKDVSEQQTVEDDPQALQSCDVPFRLPSFVSLKVLNNFIFEANGEVFEYVDGMFFKKVASLIKGSSFGEIALQRKCTRTASIKTETDCQFMFLTKDSYQSSLMKIKEDVEQERVTFLKNIPFFRAFSRSTVLSFYWGFQQIKYYRNGVVFDENDEASFVYVVFKGTFEMQKKLPVEDKRLQAFLYVKKGEEKPTVESILNKKFPDMKDLPRSQKITIFEPKSLFGYDDILYRKDEHHSTKVVCTSKKGTLWLMRKDQFLRLSKSQSSWLEV